MNILYIARTFPTDKSDGARQRTSFIYESLKEIGNVYTLLPVWEEELSSYDLDKGIQEVNVRPKGVMANFIYKVLHKKIWKRMPMLAQTFFPNYIHKKIFPNVKFDLVVVRYTENISLFKPWKIAPTIVDIDDHPLELFNYKIKDKNRLINKLYYNLLKKHLTKIYNKCSYIWIANKSHLQYIKKPNVSCLSNIANVKNIKKIGKIEQENILLSVGLLGYAPNFNGINKFLDLFWDDFHKKAPSWQYYIAGGNIRTVDLEKWSRLPNVKVLGYVEDLEELYAKAKYVITPVYTGSGTCIKVLESLLYSRVCLGPSFAFRGLEEDFFQQNGCFCIDNKSSDQICDFILNTTGQERIKMEKKGQELARKRFSYENFSAVVRNSVKKVISK